MRKPNMLVNMATEDMYAHLDKKLSVREIAALLGYSSESYFCRHFKQKTAITPAEYTRLAFSH